MVMQASMARRSIGFVVTLAVILVVAAGVTTYLVTRPAGYRVTIVFPEATDLNKGSLVEVQGFPVGKVASLGLNDGQAMVTVSVNGQDDPLHSGTTAKVDYKALIGERYVEIDPGPASNPQIPSGGIITGGEDRVELQDVLQALDPQARRQLADLIPQLSLTLGQPATVSQTLSTAAPTVTDLAQLLDAVGSQGTALHQLVATMADLSTRLVSQQQAMVSTVSGLTAANSAVAAQDNELTTGLRGLPGTLADATTTLGKLPSTATQVVPLLNDLQPGAAALPQFSTDLEPVLDELPGTIAQLQPSLSSLTTLLRYTPGLATTANGTLPGLTQAATSLTQARSVTVPTDAAGTTTTSITTSVFDWFRAYTPELADFQTNWGDWLAAYNASGHIGPFTSVLGTGAMTGSIATTNGYESPATTGPTGTPAPATATNGPPFPGTVAGQPCNTCYDATDAAGNPVG